ncbi:MAG: 30S ribosomal protein S3ae [Nitrososphaeria archaeon]
MSAKQKREKIWLTVYAPPYFGGSSIATIPTSRPESAIGRVIEITLYDLLKLDPSQYVIKLYFQIEKVEGESAYTRYKGHDYTVEYLNSLVRRGTSMINWIHDYRTKDELDLRVYAVAFTQYRINTSRKHAIRELAHEVLQSRIPEMTLGQYAQEAVLGKLASEIYNETKKVAILRHVGIRKTKLLTKLEERPPLELPYQVQGGASPPEPEPATPER